MFKFDLISIILEHKKYIEKSNISDILIIVPDFKQHTIYGILGIISINKGGNGKWII